MADRLIKEAEEAVERPLVESSGESSSEAAEWAGYLFMDWKIADSLLPGDITPEHVVYALMNYDVLHTQDVGYAIDRIKERAGDFCAEMFERHGSRAAEQEKEGM